MMPPFYFLFYIDINGKYMVPQSVLREDAAGPIALGLMGILVTAWKAPCENNDSN